MSTCKNNWTLKPRWRTYKGDCKNCGGSALQHMKEARNDEGYWKYDIDHDRSPSINYKVKDRETGQSKWVFVDLLRSYNWVQQKYLEKVKKEQDLN